MKDAYPDLVQRRATIASIVKMEEEKFLETLETGTRKLNELVATSKTKKMSVLAGKDVFQLYDTYGFPFELTREMAQSHGLSIDEAGFKQAQEQAAELAREAWKGSGAQDVGSYHAWKAKINGKSVFKGYDTIDLDSDVVGPVYLAGAKGISEAASLSAGQEGEVVLRETPFYPEGGGQVADRGTFEWQGGKADVLDTQSPVEGMIVHRVKITAGNLSSGTKVRAKVDSVLREATMRHHTATHLLHKALREVLGTHVTQAGSLVAPDRLRFDFNHNAPLSPQERQRVEDIVNGQILNDIPVRACKMTKDQAHQVGAMMLFGEKYGTDVRAVMVSPHDCTRAQEAWSLELCGGTHVHATGQVGLFKIVSQSAVSAGVRRLEAVAGRAAIQAVRRMEHQLQTLAETLKTTPDELVPRVDRLLAKESELEKKIQQQKSGELKSQVEEIAKKTSKVGSLDVIIMDIDADAKQMREMIDRLKDLSPAQVLILSTQKDEKISFVVAAGKNADRMIVDANKIAKGLAAEIEGSGGGRPDFAQGGGKVSPRFTQKLIEDVIAKHARA
jgi:alanyl-tRNA synthetase